MTDIVLAPLRSGTGTSLKVLEAFVHEKALVATAIGVRGYPVQGRKWSAWFATIFNVIRKSSLSLRANPSSPALRSAKAGRAFVKGYDYRVVYRPYLECIDNS